MFRRTRDQVVARNGVRLVAKHIRGAADIMDMVIAQRAAGVRCLQTTGAGSAGWGAAVLEDP